MQVGKRLHEQLCTLGATSVLPLGYVDENVSESKFGGECSTCLIVVCLMDFLASQGWLLIKYPFCRYMFVICATPVWRSGNGLKI